LRKFAASSAQRSGDYRHRCDCSSSNYAASLNAATGPVARFAKQCVFRLGDREVEPFIATERGLIVGRSSPRMIPVDKIFFDQALPGILEEMRKADEAVVVLIEPNGFETAFQLEAIASRHGPGRMRGINSKCQFAKIEAVASHCDDLLRRLRGGRS
jgi:hypothetical protein